MKSKQIPADTNPELHVPAVRGSHEQGEMEGYE